MALDWDGKIPRCETLIKAGKRLTWLNRDLWVKIKNKRELHTQWRQEQVTWEVHGNATQLCRDDVRKNKAKPWS